MSITLPTIDELNAANSTEHVFLGILRMLNTSDLAFTYMLLKPSTIEDICDVCDRILSQEAIPDEFKTPTQLSDVEKMEYVVLAQRLSDEAKRLAPAPKDETTMDILRSYWMNSDKEDLIDLVIDAMPADAVKEVVERYMQQQREAMETDLEFDRQMAQLRTLQNLTQGMEAYKKETLIDIARSARSFDFRGDVLLNDNQLDEYVRLINMIDAYTGVDTTA